jgi:hypothetical protein
MDNGQVESSGYATEEKVKLLTVNGRLVVELQPKYNAHIYIMTLRPEVIIWGSRFFIKKDNTTYIEAMAAIGVGY